MSQPAWSSRVTARMASQSSATSRRLSVSTGYVTPPRATDFRRSTGSSGPRGLQGEEFLPVGPGLPTGRGHSGELRLLPPAGKGGVVLEQIEAGPLSCPGQGCGGHRAVPNPRRAAQDADLVPLPGIVFQMAQTHAPSLPLFFHCITQRRPRQRREHRGAETKSLHFRQKSGISLLTRGPQPPIILFGLRSDKKLQTLSRVAEGTAR